MPTPKGQSQIPPPWIGQGSISSVYGIDVINDHASKDGWQLMYNTFNANASGSLINPYFILYNPYRGLMRIYFYITTQFALPSDYVTDGLSVVSNNSTSMLNYMGTDIVDASQNQLSYTQIEPAPKDGSKPLASNKWYMLQYEFAYDPNVSAINYSNIQLSWFTNYNSITQVSLGGKITGTLNGTIGSTSNGINAALLSGGKTAATGALAVIGNDFINSSALDNSKDPANLPNNSLGLSDDSFSAIQSGITSGLKAFSSNSPAAIIGFLSGILGGNSTSAQTVSLNLNANITLTGTQTNSGSFPSSPTSFWVPGTQGLSLTNNTIQGFIPLYNQPLGVFNLNNRPTVYAHTTYNNIIYRRGDAGLLSYNTQSTFTFDNTLASTLMINPQISNNAKVTLLSAKLVLLPSGLYPSGISFGNPSSYSTDGTSTIIGSKSYYYNPTHITEYFTLGSGNIAPVASYTGKAYIQIILKVTPNNGAPASAIVKTFLANVVQK
jgi:hypothetical protein